MNKNDTTKKTLCTIAKIIAFLIFLNLVGFMIGKGIQRAMKLSKKAQKEAHQKHKDHDCHCHEGDDCHCEDEDCTCNEEDEVEYDDGCDGYCLEEEVEDTEAVVPDTTSDIRCRHGEGCTSEDPYMAEVKKPE